MVKYNDRLSFSIHDFSLYLTEIRRINAEDPTREGRVNNPVYHLGHTGIFGNATDCTIDIWFPKTMFPMNEKDYFLQTKLGDLGLVISDEPKHMAYKCKFNYVLRRLNAITKKPGIQVGNICPTESKKRVNMLLHTTHLKNERELESILDAIIIQGLKVKVN